MLFLISKSEITGDRQMIFCLQPTDGTRAGNHWVSLEKAITALFECAMMKRLCAEYADAMIKSSSASIRI